MRTETAPGHCRELPDPEIAMVPVETRKAQLEVRLQDLKSRLHSIADELDEPASKDFEERATEREGEEVLEDLGAAGLQEIRMIEAALDRIECGTYGICVSCGDPISDARLDVLPQTPRCRECASGS
jgi:RNA polymerase-binding transcription factor DksA